MKSVINILRELFFLVGSVAGLILFFYYWEVLTGWLGAFLGTVVALFVAPGVFVFPLIYWVVQGAFPSFYFKLLAICAVSAFGVVFISR